MPAVEADVAIVGSGLAGLLVARQLTRAGRRVVVLERGALKTHAQQLRDGRHAGDVPGATPNHVTRAGTPSYPWSYVYGVGGSSLHWSGVTPRFTASDFRMRSDFGVMSDWPFGLEELLPHYEGAERLLAVAGAPGAVAQPAHPFSPMDRAIAPHLQPYAALPQARPSRPVDGRPACCGSATCELCPVDSRFSALNGLREVLESPLVDLRPQSVVARIRRDRGGRRVRTLECIGRGGRRFDVQAQTTVLAAGGFESPALLLRSSIERDDTGRYLFDHAHRTFLVRLKRQLGPGRGQSLSTGTSLAFRDGAFRSSRSAGYLSPYNPGISLTEPLIAALGAGLEGKAARRAALHEWRRTLPLDALLEDLPRANRRVRLARAKDSLGLPKVEVEYGAGSEYQRDGATRIKAELERRLAPLGLESLEDRPGPAGGHLLGTCRIGAGGRDGVVDADLRHLDVENLHVVGGSVFPTYSPAHPTLTICALALRLGAHLAA